MQQEQQQGKPKTAAIASYRDLEVWQLAMAVVETCYRLTTSFPAREQFELVAQMRRSAVSIPSNIAEGQGRRMTGAYLQHLSVAAGSHAELETQVEVARRLGYLTQGDAEEIVGQLRSLGRMLTALIRAVRVKDGRPPQPRGSNP